MKKAILAAVFAVMAAGPAAASMESAAFKGGTDFFSRLGADIPDAPVPAANPPAADEAAGYKEWTVMVFINGKNDLEQAGLNNVNQMEKTGSTRDMNIVVELGRMNGQADGDTHADGDWTGIRRMLVTKDNDEGTITSPVLQVEKVADMGDYKRVVDFVAWAKQKFPAKRYMLILWDHGAGWMDPKSSEKGISFDNETGNYIRTAQIGLILKEAGKVDVLAFDACMMNMAEVDYEVKEQAKVIVGSEDAVPDQGFPYDLILGALADKPEMGTEAAGAMMVENYNSFYAATKEGVQLSAIRGAKLDGLAAKMADFARSAKELGDMDAMKAARTGVIRYSVVNAKEDPDMKIGFYGDVAQFAGLVSANLKEEPAAAALKERSAALQDFIDKELVIRNKATGNNRVGRNLAESRGISVYLPPAELRARQERIEVLFEGKYSDFAFSGATRWYDFVTFLYGAK